jgi:multiple sugar transport system permease protein
MATTARTASTRSAGTGAAAARRRGRPGRRLEAGVHHGLLGLLAIAWLVPVLWMVSMALTPDEALRRSSVGLIPDGVTAQNFIDVFRVGYMPRWFLNSFIVTGVATATTVIVCAMAGYAFATLRFRGRRLLFVLVIAGLMVPKEALFVPLFLMFAGATSRTPTRPCSCRGSPSPSASSS